MQDKLDSRLILQKISSIVKNEQQMSDLELANAINSIKDDNVHFLSPRLEKVLEKRVREFCAKHGFTIEEYEGVLPWRKTKIK